MRQRALGIPLIAPALGLIIMILFFPAVYGFYYSLFDIRFLRLGRFLGLENYANLLKNPELQTIIFRTGVFTFFSVGLAIVAATALALWVTRLRGLGAFVAQIVIILPWVISSVVGPLLFRWVFVNDIGLLVYALQRLGLGTLEPLSHPVSAMVLLVIVAVWRTLGFAFVLILAGLKSIPDELYEAATVDGANSWQAFWGITLPLLKTPLLISLVVLSLSNINNVETPLITTGGAPGGMTNILPLELYQQAFAYYDFSTATSLAIGMFVANILLVLAYVRLVNWRV